MTSPSVATTKMTKERLAAIGARLAAATTGPWEAATGASGHCVFGGTSDLTFLADAVRWPDAQLIAHAPSDLADLLAHVAELQRSLEEYREDRQALIDGSVRRMGNVYGDVIWVVRTHDYATAPEALAAWRSSRSGGDSK